MRNTAESKERNRSDKIYYIICILFSIIVYHVHIANDDEALSRLNLISLSDYINDAINHYKTWSSRVVINEINRFFLCSNMPIPRILWAFFMGVSLFVLLKSLSILFTDKSREKCIPFIIGIVMMYPFAEMKNAGWITTMNFYWAPVAFGLMSLVPIKKVLQGERIAEHHWKYALYILCLIYGANNEQMMIVILLSYMISLVYCTINKKYNWFHVLMSLLAVGSCIIFIICPGNRNRLEVEIRWFHTYHMFNIYDKIDMGYATTIKHLLCGNYLFIIFTCLLFSFIICRKYSDSFIHMISIIPAASIVLLGPLKSILISVYPSLSVLTDYKIQLADGGFVTAENNGDMGAFGQFLFFSLLIILIGIEIILLLDTFRDIIICYTLLVAGMASRVAMGLSPTIYASSTRTFLVLDIAIISVCILVYDRSVANGTISSVAQERINAIMYLSIFFSFFNLCFLVGNTFK